LITPQYKNPLDLTANSCKIPYGCPSNTYKDDDVIYSSIPSTLINNNSWYLQFENDGSTNQKTYTVTVLKDTYVDLLVVAGGGAGGPGTLLQISQYSV